MNFYGCFYAFSDFFIIDLFDQKIQISSENKKNPNAILHAEIYEISKKIIINLLFFFIYLLFTQERKKRNQKRTPSKLN